MMMTMEEQDYQNTVLNQQTKKRKRKLPKEYHDNDYDNGLSSESWSMDELLNRDMLEKVLSWLPTSSFFRVSSVCKRWSSIAASASFKLACSQIPSREPWFFMVDPHFDESVVFDTSEMNWKRLNKRCRPCPCLHQNHSNCSNLIPVAASGGLICFRCTVSGGFFISNPVTGACRDLPPLPLPQNPTIHAIAMNNSSSSFGHSHSSSSYNLVLVSGEIPHLSVWVYESGKHCWREDITKLRSRGKKMDEEDSQESDVIGGEDDDEVLYFLSKTGDVVATNMQRSPSKQYSSVITTKNGEEIIYFLSSTGTVSACDLVKKTFFEYPRLLPVCFEYSIDVVECNGEMLVVVLSELLETASLRVWRFTEEEEEKDGMWRQIAAMPPSMSHEFYGKKADINCVGAGNERRIMICVNSGEISRYLMCDLEGNVWSELPKCVVDGKAMEFMSAFSFEPRIEACV